MIRKIILLMKYRYLVIICSMLIVSCGLFNSNEQGGGFEDKVYIALQNLDQVGIMNIDTETMQVINIDYTSINCSEYDAEMACNMAMGCMWMNNHCMQEEDQCMGLNEINCSNADGCNWTMDMCMESGGMMGMGGEFPHFIVVDEINGYWFVTTSTSGYVGRYMLDTGLLIDKLYLGDFPAIMVINEANKKLYVSRMMLMPFMPMMASGSKIIHEIDYADPAQMTISYRYELIFSYFLKRVEARNRMYITIWKFLSDVVEYPGEMSQGEGHPAIELNFGKF